MAKQKSLKVKKEANLKVLIPTIILSVIVVATAIILIVYFTTKTEVKNYAVDIFDSGKYSKIEYSNLQNAEFEDEDYFVYIYQYSSLEETLNVEVCSDDKECSYLAERNNLIAQFLDRAVEAGLNVYILDADDLYENADVLSTYSEPTIIHVVDSTELDDDFTYSGTNITKEILNQLENYINSLA